MALEIGRKMLVIILLTVILYCFATPIIAQVASGANPTGVHVFPHQGVFVFYATVTEGELPACSGDHRWAISTDAPGAKELISMVTAAKVANRTITVIGNDACNPTGFGYYVNYLYLN